MDEHGSRTLWLAEHHFQREGRPARRSRGGAAGVPTVEHDGKVGAWFAGPPEQLVAYLKSLETTYPGLEHVHLSNCMGTPQNVMLEQLAWLGKEVMPSCVSR